MKDYVGKINYLSPEDLIPYQNNTKKHPPKQIDKIASSIAFYGFDQPIVVDGNNVIIKGHGRHAAAKKLGLETVPVLIRTDLTETETKALRIADNKVAVSDFDFEKLETELKILNELDFKEFDTLGFDDKELSELMLSDFENTDTYEDGANEEEDEAPALEENPIVENGQIWLLGRHRLMCGDSVSNQDVSVLMNGSKADMVFTDPPYGYKYESNAYANGNPFGMLKNDDKFSDFLPLCIENAKENASFYICTAHQVIDYWKNYVSNLLKYKNIIIWVKGGGGMGDLKGAYSSQYEMVIFAHKGRVEMNNGRHVDVWNFPKEPPKDHPTQKPVDLVVFAIENSCPEKGVLLDLFGGSGTTLIAAEKTDKNCLMMELDPKYCDVIIKRWQNYTGKEAVLESTGQSFNELSSE